MNTKSEAELAFDLFKQFSGSRCLGNPSKILTHVPDVPALGIFGVGAQWGEGKEATRTAYKVSSQEAAEELKHLMNNYGDKQNTLNG